MDRYRICMELRANGGQRVTVERHRKGLFGRDVWEALQYYESTHTFRVVYNEHRLDYPTDFETVIEAKNAIDKVLAEEAYLAGMKVIGEPRYEEYP